MSQQYLYPNDGKGTLITRPYIACSVFTSVARSPLSQDSGEKRRKDRHVGEMQALASRSLQFANYATPSGFIYELNKD